MPVRLKAALAFGLSLAAVPALAQPVGSAEPATVAPDPGETLQVAAGVASLHHLSHQGELGGTIFSLVGGDPAMNGEYIILSFDVSPAEGSRNFRIGDVLEYHIVSEAPGRVLLQVRENVMRDGGEIGERSRRVAVTWTLGPDGAPPNSVTVATAP